MRLESLKLQNFRNYQRETVTWHPHLNLLYGLNAQGKSNVLEAIYFLSVFSSFRNGGHEDMVRKGADYFFLEGNFQRQSGAHQIKAAFSLDKKRLLKLDGNGKRKIGQMIGHLNVVIFSPEDLLLVKGGPQGRRKF